MSADTNHDDGYNNLACCLYFKVFAHIDLLQYPSCTTTRSQRQIGSIDTVRGLIMMRTFKKAMRFFDGRGRKAESNGRELTTSVPSGRYESRGDDVNAPPYGHKAKKYALLFHNYNYRHVATGPTKRAKTCDDSKGSNTTNTPCTNTRPSKTPKPKIKNNNNITINDTRFQFNFVYPFIACRSVVHATGCLYLVSIYTPEGRHSS